jgi:hypothetical protein
MDTTTKIIKLNSMVKLEINDSQWIGQVVEIRKDTALIKLMDNMHYHASLDDLQPLSGRTPKRFQNTNKASGNK